MPRPLRWLTGLLLAGLSLNAQSTTSSLAGEWRFALDRADAGVTEAWFNRDLPDRITLPRGPAGAGLWQ